MARIKPILDIILKVREHDAYEFKKKPMSSQIYAPMMSQKSELNNFKINIISSV